MGDKIKKLRGEALEQVLIIIYGEQFLQESEPESEFEIDLEKISDEILEKLEALTKEKEVKGD